MLLEISGIQARPWLSLVRDDGSTLGMLFPPSCPGRDSGVPTPLAVSDPDPGNPVPPRALPCENHQEKAQENPSRSSRPLVFSPQNHAVGATVGMQEVPVPVRGVLACRVSLGLSLAWWVCPQRWHSRVGTAAALLAAAVTRSPCVLQEYIPEYSWSV